MLARTNRSLTVVFFGGKGTGKTNLWSRLQRGNVDDQDLQAQVNTLRCAPNSGLFINKTTREFTIFDFPSTEDITNQKNLYTSIDVLVGVFAVDKLDTIDELVGKAREVAATLNLEPVDKKVPLVLVGNKTDLSADAGILNKVATAKEQLEKLGFEVIFSANDSTLGYTPVGAKKGSGIDDLLVAGLNAAAKLAIAQKAQPPQPTLAQPEKEEEQPEKEKIPGFFKRNPNAELYIKRGLVVLGVLAFVAAIVVGGILSGGALFAVGAGAGIGILAAAAHSAICVGAVALLGSYGAAILGVLGMAAGAIGTIFCAYKAKDLFYTREASPQGPLYKYESQADPNAITWDGSFGSNPLSTQANIKKRMEEEPGIGHEKTKMEAADDENPDLKNSKKAKNSLGLLGWFKRHIGSSSNKKSDHGNFNPPRPGNGSNQE